MKGFGFGFGFSFGRQSGIVIDPQAQAYYDRVIADGGIVTMGLTALSNFYTAVKAARGQSDINNCFLSHYYAGFGLKLAAGTGATAGNRACSKLYNLIGATNDAEQTAPANQPLALVHTGENYAYFPGVSNNTISTPNATANNFLNNFDIKVRVRNFQNSIINNSGILSKGGNSATGGFNFTNQVSGQKTLGFRMIQGGVVSANNSTAQATITNGWVRVTRNATNGQIIFYESTDGVNWVQIGSTITSITGAIDASSDSLFVGSFQNNGTPFLGEIQYLSIADSIDGIPSVIFDPSTYNRSVSQTTFTSGGAVYTLNTPATNNALKAAIVDQTMIMGNGTSYGLRAANLNINQTAITSYTAFRKFVNSVGVHYINELGANADISQGKAMTINGVANTELNLIYANIGINASRFSSNSLELKLATYINNIANANESSPYLINNVAQSLIANIATTNNTAAMNQTGYNLLARNNAASLWANVILIGDSICAGEDSAGVQTAMWDIYKTHLNVA